MPELLERDEFFLNVPEKLDRPWDDFRHFREHKPVFLYEPLDTWFVFGFDEVDRLFHDPRLSSRRADGFVAAAPPEGRADVEAMRDTVERWLMFLDEPKHMQVRRLLQPHLAEKPVDHLAPRIREIAQGLLATQAGPLDVAADYAYPLPVLVLGELFGVPSLDRRKLIGWSDAIAEYFNTLPATPELAHRLRSACEEFTAFLRDLLESRRSAPTDDLLGDLVRCEAVDEADILANVLVLLVAGHETTRNLIGSALWLLLTHPEELAKVRADRTLIRNVVEETLRLEPPNPFMARRAVADVEIGGQTLRAGQMVYLVMASANRDPVHFPDPDRFDVTRRPGKHLSFGSGPHYCVGAILARREGAIALQTLLETFPDLRLDPARPPVFHRSAGMRGVVSLPVLG